jgi:hypothetical protein
LQSYIAHGKLPNYTTTRPLLGLFLGFNMHILSTLFLIFSAFYLQPILGHPSDLVDCGPDGREGVVQAFCSNGHKIMKWKIGRENFERFHEAKAEGAKDFFTPVQPLRYHFRDSWFLQYCNKCIQIPEFAYQVFFVENEDERQWMKEYYEDTTDGCLTWGPYVDIQSPSEIEYEVDVWAELQISRLPQKSSTDCRVDWHDLQVMFQLELYTDGKILDKVVINWKKYQTLAQDYDPAFSFLSCQLSETAIYLSKNGALTCHDSTDNYYKVRGVYKSNEPLRNVEVRICKFFPAHKVFFIKDMSLKATYN